MSENVARNMQSSQGIINYPTELHLVGHFRIFILVLLVFLIITSEIILQAKYCKFLPFLPATADISCNTFETHVELLLYCTLFCTFVLTERLGATITVRIIRIQG